MSKNDREPLTADIGFIFGRILRNIFRRHARKPCEYCRSNIKAAATVCRFCHRDVA